MNVEVKIHRNERPTPIGKLADAELHFTSGDLAGLKLVGFAVWERRDGPGRNVSFPARQFIVHGDKRNFALLRAIDDPNAQNQVRDLVLRAYAEQAHERVEAVS